MGFDWESILEWIKIGEETWNNYHPSDLQCQQRLICELNENPSMFGFTAEKFIEALS